MKFALVNPPWSFEGSIYFGCREPHLPLEFGYARALLHAAGHEAEIFDAQLGFSTTVGGPDRAALQADPLDALAREVADYAPNVAVVTTAPSYLFWRCAPPELRVPQLVTRALRPFVPTLIAVGPHASSTPTTTLAKLGVDAAVVGECEDILPQLASPHSEWRRLASVASWNEAAPHANGPTHTTDMAALPPLEWPDEAIRAHRHHHHRFDAEPSGPGAEMEASRGCPYHCSFCAKDNFRNAYRKRPLTVMLAELDRLRAQGIEYVYFVDEIFLPNRELLQALVPRAIRFGVQTRIDLWPPDLLDLLGRAGCVSIEAGVESITPEGRNLLDKNSRLTTEQITDRLLRARETVPFVQANLIDASTDDPEAVEAWRRHLISRGVWANTPVPMFPYPGSPDYTKRWGAADDQAWERAHSYYLAEHQRFSDIQDERPLPLDALELRPPCRAS